MKPPPSTIVYEFKGVSEMSLIINEIKLTIQDCENNKKSMLRECERMNEDRKAYQHIKHLMGVIDYEENNTVRQDS